VRSRVILKIVTWSLNCKPRDPYVTFDKIYHSRLLDRESVVSIRAATAQILVGFIRSEVPETGLPRIIVGLSGGVDSALSATVAAEGLGPETGCLDALQKFQSR
jgi:asparagine synthetase B (glutamine-hydrolysing)